MRFQTKVLVTYSLLILFLVVVLGISFYRYSAGLFERNAASNYSLVASKISRQLDDVIRPMDFISTNLLSDGPFKSALASLASIDRSDPRNTAFITEAARTIRSQLWTYSIIKNFHGVVVFNRKGDIFSSAFVEHAQATASAERLQLLPWLSAASAAEGRAIVVSPYEDPWSPEPRPLVFSFARAIPGSDDGLGFLEVQKSYAELEEVFEVSGGEYVRVLAFRSDGALFYGSQDLSPSITSYYREAAATEPHVRFERNPVSLERELIVSDTSRYSGLTVVIVLNRRFLLGPLLFTRWATVIVAFLIILFSVAFNWVSSRQLAKPLRLIKSRMEETELANLPSRRNELGREPIDHPNDEVVALDHAFRGLTERLDEAIRNELHARTAWMQARLDSLQAQINPHFLYNILTVIASKGLERGDEEIGEICAGIASMLRYSTSTAERSATLAEELEHVRTYLFLMKKRLEDRLDFSFDVDERMLGEEIPKIVLQQIAENSINHGYRTTRSRLSIRIRGYVEDGRWTLEVMDDGAGFVLERLAELRSRITTLDAELRSGGGGSGMEIGGLGLINTYTRLHLFYHGDFVWELGTLSEGGARVVLGAALHSEMETSSDGV